MKNRACNALPKQWLLAQATHPGRRASGTAASTGTGAANPAADAYELREQGHRFEEIAAALRMNVANCRQTYKRALKRLSVFRAENR
jgi:hypothetical protein